MSKKLLNSVPKNIRWSGLAINFERYKLYDLSFFSWDEILVFEFLVMKSILADKKEFKFTQPDAERELGIKIGRYKKIIGRFKEEGFISVRKKTTNTLMQATHIKVDFNAILNSLEMIIVNNPKNRTCPSFIKFYELYEGI